MVYPSVYDTKSAPKTETSHKKMLDGKIIQLKLNYFCSFSFHMHNSYTMLYCKYTTNIHNTQTWSKVFMVYGCYVFMYN